MLIISSAVVLIWKFTFHAATNIFHVNMFTVKFLFCREMGFENRIIFDDFFAIEVFHLRPKEGIFVDYIYDSDGL